MSEKDADKVSQQPLQKWLVLTEHGVELEPIGNRPLVDEMASAIRPYRRRTSVVTKAAYERAYGGKNAI